MKILVVNPGSYTTYDFMIALSKLFGEGSAEELGYFFDEEDTRINDRFEKLFTDQIKSKKYDLVYSTNFYPIIARLCHEANMKYIAWSYDSPIEAPCDEMNYETNHIFLFDRMDVLKYRSYGYDNFYHLPLAVNTDRYDIFESSDKYGGEISFMARLYRSNHLSLIKEGLSNELVEYIDKLISVQKSTIGKFVVDDLISQPIIDEMNRQYLESGRKFQIIKEQLSITIAEYVTYLDRIVLLEMLSKRFDTHFYTWNINEDEQKLLKNVKIHDQLNYYKEMPIMFKSSKINLSGNFRSCKSAIPLRSLDILGCGGFLLSPSQPELLEHFKEAKEVVTYTSEDEAVDKAGYYLAHEEERLKIARAGYEKVKRDFRYEDKILEMFKISGIETC